MYRVKDISIHPSRVGWDLIRDGKSVEDDISIHPSRVGWDRLCIFGWGDFKLFQSTHPVWDGTAKNI